MNSITTTKSVTGWRRIILQLKAILQPIDFIEQRTGQYGDFYQVTSNNLPPSIVTNNPQAIEDILTAPADKLIVGKANKRLGFLVGDNSLLLLDGKKHRQQRRLLMPHFHGKSLQQCSEDIVRITNQVSDRLEVNRPFKVRDLTQEITMRVILKVVFGLDSGKRQEALRELLSNLLETFNSPLSSSLIFFPWLQQDWGRYSPWGRFLRLQQEIKTLIYAEIKERRALLAANPNYSQDILSLLLLARDKNGEGMTDEELHDELITLLFAGHETTASALAWLFYWVHYVPEVESKLRFELNNWSPGDRQTDTLTYLNAVVAETLRIYPIAIGTFIRVLTQPVSIMGHEIAPNTSLMISIYALHHREDLYPNAPQFNPQRFIDRTYSNYEYLPFGGGNRRCIGSALALMEMKLVTATILSRFNLQLVSDRPLKPVRRGVTLAPPASLTMKITSKINN
ncbi:MAG: cytochrome P450 [Cyanobacteria bacterium J06621_8]